MRNSDPHCPAMPGFPLAVVLCSENDAVGVRGRLEVRKLVKESARSWQITQGLGPTGQELGTMSVGIELNHILVVSLGDKLIRVSSILKHFKNSHSCTSII